MKTKLLLLLSVCIGMTSSAWAELGTTTIGGKTYYQIGDANDLAEFATLVNGGKFTANAVLIDNIDMSELDSWDAIGDWSTGSGSNACYKGHFDGQGYTISNFTFASNQKYFGVFGVVSTGALIEDFKIDGTITNKHTNAGVVAYARDATPTIRNVHSYLNINSDKDGTKPGGILGSAVNGTTVIENCTYSGTLNVGGHTGNIGGIVGYVNNNSAAILNVTNCLFDGEIQNGTGTGECGGIIGYNNGGVATITGCLSLGSITSGKAGQFFGALNGNNSTYVGYNYYVGAAAQTGSGIAEGTAPVEVNSTQLASGEICYKLNGEQSNIAFYQTLPGDPVPTLDNTHKQVYANGSFKCDGVTPKGDVEYSNIDASSVDSHIFVDGFCSVCSALDVDYMAANAEGYLEIGTTNQLKWFATYVNQVKPKANAVLTADIDLNGVAWTPMCGGSGNVAPGETAYAGTFDGQGHSITGFNAEGVGHLGLFSDANNANIKNFSISGSLKVTGGYCGGVVANLTNCIIENVHSALIIDVPNSETHHVGGVVGTARGGNIIKRCSFDGSMTVASGSTDNSAGIAAYITNGDKVIDCVNYGDVTFKDINCAAGGIVGYVNAQEAYVQNCLTIGKILFDGEGAPKYGGAILGRTKGFSAEKVTNNYWLEGSAYGSAKKNDGSDPKVAPSVTTEQLASGEVTAKLGIAFRQNLEDEGESKKDPYPVIPMSYEDLLEHDVVVKISEAGYATLYIPDVDVVADEIKAFTGEINGEKLELIPVKDKTSGVCIIPAQTAVILKGAPGIYSLIPGFGAAKIEGNVLKGSAEDTEAAGKYVLAKPENAEVGFYLANAGTIKAGKAYLELPSTEVKAFYFGGENETAIVSPLGETKEGVAIYNIAGQRISKLQKGVNIVSGHKVLF